MKYIFLYYPILSTTLLTTFTALTFFFIFTFTGWPGRTNGCFENYLTQGDCYCERPRIHGLVAQPLNTYSNLAFLFVALFLSWSADTRRFPSKWWKKHDNLFTAHNWFAYSYTSVVAFIGLGSMYMHASFTYWGGGMDVVSMMLFTGFTYFLSIIKFVMTVSKINSKQAQLRASQVHAGVYCSSMFLLVILYFEYEAHDGLTLFKLFLSTTILLEGLIRIIEGLWIKSRTASLWLYFSALLTFAIALAALSLSESGKFLCFPNSIFQGHSVWHVTCAISAGILFFYQLSEHSIETYTEENSLVDDSNSEEDYRTLP